MKWIEFILRKIFKIKSNKVETPKKHSRVSKEEINLMRDLYQAEWEIESIVQLTGRCRSTVYNYVRDLK